MELLAFIVPFVLLGGAVLFVAFSGSPGQAREAYLTRGNTAFKLIVPVAFVVLGVGIPALVLANRGEAEGGTGSLRSEHMATAEANGKLLFRQRCSSCHTLSAVNARGVTGPNLDRVGELNKKRVLTAIRVGGTGQGRMPKQLLTGPDADDVAEYLSKVAGRN
jgi:hypothetical protein